MGTLTDNQIEVEQLFVDAKALGEMISDNSSAIISVGFAQRMIQAIGELTTLRAEVEQLRAYKAECENQKPVTHQYKSTTGEWCNFADDRHRDATIDSEAWQIRELYAHPIPSDRVADKPASIGFSDALKVCEAGLKAWSEKPHNKKWFKQIDGTPIPNDLICCIAQEFSDNYADDDLMELHAVARFEESCVVDKPRITEQDAREIAQSALSFWRNTVNLTLDVWLKDHAPTLLNKLNADREPAVSVPEKLDAIRYQRLRVLGVAPFGSQQLESSTVFRFQNLDSFVDDDLQIAKNRGEAMLSASPAPDSEALSMGSAVSVMMTGEQLAYLWLMLRHVPIAYETKTMLNLLSHVRDQILSKTIDGRFLESNSDWTVEPKKHREKIERFMRKLFINSESPAPDSEGDKP